MLRILSLLIFLIFLFPNIVFARVTPDDIYQAKKSAFENNLNKISDPAKKQTVLKADQILNQVNQTVCARFDVDIAKLSAILEEEKSRRKVTKTVVAYGQGNTPLDSASYYLNYAAEAVAYQKIQDYTPQIYAGNLAAPVNSSINNLEADLQTVLGKILRAKNEIKKSLD
jgi:hypothetical protein